MSADFMKLPMAEQARIRRELQPGETVMWAGRPDPDRLMRSGFLLWFFFLPWTAFAVVWITGMSGFGAAGLSRPQPLFALLGLPFLCIGIMGLLSPLWLRMKAMRTLYVITSARALVLQGRRKVSVNAWPPAALAAVTRVERPDGSGDLLFSSEVWLDRQGNRHRREQGFIAVRDVRSVEMYLRQLLATRH